MRSTKNVVSAAKAGAADRDVANRLIAKICFNMMVHLRIMVYGSGDD